MARNDVAVLDFASSKLTMLVGHKGVNNSFKIVASSECDYAGFMSGEFLEPNELAGNIRSVYNDLIKKYPKKIKKLFIGVPAEFCYNLEKDLTLNLNKRTKITQNHLLKLFCTCDNVVSTSHTVINKSPMFYLLDDTKTSNPINCYGTNLVAKTCFILVENEFVYHISSIMQEIGVKDFEFLSDILAEGVFMIPEHERDRGALLVDCGYLTTCVSHFVGEGITDLKNFAMGGALITSDISEMMGLSFNVAEQIKRKLILTLKPTALDYYEAYDGNEMVKISAKDANNIALARLDLIAENIVKCIEIFNTKPNDYSPVYLTGGGISYLKGIKYFLRGALNREIIILEPCLQYKAPDLSSVISLLNAGISIND